MRLRSAGLVSLGLIVWYSVGHSNVSQAACVLAISFGAFLVAAHGFRNRRGSARLFAALMTAALGLWAAAWAGWEGTILATGAVPDPESMINVVFMAGSVALFLALSSELWRRERSLVGLLDVAIIAASLLVVAWVVLLHRYVGAPLPTLARSVQIGYGVTDVLLVAAALRLVVEPVCRTRQGLTLVGASLALVFSDLVWNWATVLGTYSPGAWSDVGWLVWAVLGAAVARRDSVSALFRDRNVTTLGRHSQGRLALLALAALVSPSIFLAERAAARSTTEAPLIVGGAVIALLVTAVLALLLRDSRALHERSAEIAALVSASEDAVIGTSADGTITSWNRGAELIYGWTEDETVGNSLEMIVPEETRDSVSKSLGELMRGGVTVIRHQAQGLHRDGHVIDVALTVCPLVVGGRLAAVSTVARDISAQVKAEAERERLVAELEAQNDQLREFDRLKDEFVASVSHELRTPLTSIRGYLELLRDDLDLDRDHDEMLGIVDRNADRLLALVDDLLFAAQVAAGKQLELHLEEIDLADVVAHAVTAAEPRAESAEVALELSSEPVYVPADSMRIAQVIDNLISNAIKFTPAGGSVRIGICERDGRAALSVADSGIGIPEEEHADLFSRFFRARAATEGAIQGTGLGLAIVKSIVDAHRGEIGFTSELGAGTTFEVSLPAVAVRQPALEQVAVA